MEKLKHSDITGGTGNVWQSLRKLNIELPYGTALSLSVLDIPHPDENVLELDNGDNCPTL